MKRLAVALGCLALALAACSSSGTTSSPVTTAASVGGSTTTAAANQTTSGATSPATGGADSCEVTYSGAKSGSISDSAPILSVDAWLTNPGSGGPLTMACSQGNATLSLDSFSQVLTTLPEGPGSYVIGSGNNASGNASTTDQLVGHLKLSDSNADFTPAPTAPGVLKVTQFDAHAFVATFTFTGVDATSGGSVTVKGSITKNCVDAAALGNVCK
jgi:hypothetical protein